MIRVLYAGSPAASATTLKLLIEKQKENGFEIAGVLTNPPSAKGRHKTPVQTEVASVARENNIPVFEPEHLDAQCREQVSSINPDMLVCFAYGHIFGPKFMELFKFGGINLHPSALPEYRGCTPVNAAIINRNSETAFTIQKVSQKMDEGNILAEEFVKLSGKENCVSLLNDAAVRGAELLAKVLCETSKNNCVAEGRVQTGEASYTGMISKQDAKIDWSKNADEIDACVRGYFEDPSSWTVEKDQPLKIHEGFAVSENDQNITEDMKNASCGSVCGFVKSLGILVRCGSGFYAVTKLQRQGKNAMDYKSFMNGARDFVGTILG